MQFLPLAVIALLSNASQRLLDFPRLLCNPFFPTLIAECSFPCVRGRMPLFPRLMQSAFQHLALIACSRSRYTVLLFPPLIKCFFTRAWCWEILFPRLVQSDSFLALEIDSLFYCASYRALPFPSFLLSSSDFSRASYWLLFYDQQFFLVLSPHRCKEMI